MLLDQIWIFIVGTERLSIQRVVYQARLTNLYSYNCLKGNIKKYKSKPTEFFFFSVKVKFQRSGY